MFRPSEILSVNGPLSKQIAGFLPRQIQQDMAESVAAALADRATLVVEAGTGTGKTFAYLVPAMLSGQKVIISTGTRNLQDQLFHKDIPVVRDALEMPVSVALLKGRGNYLCLHRLALAEGGTFHSPEQAARIQTIRQWAGRTRVGDISECSDIGENDLVWLSVTSNADNCLGQDCPVYEDCHLIQARREAQAADLVVVNHHLLFADMALREGGVAELLPAADAYIIDEAHQLPEVASGFFGHAISSNQLLELARDTENEYRQDINEDNELPRQTDVLQKQLRDLRLFFGPQQRRAAWQEEAKDAELQALCQSIDRQLETLQALLKPLSERSRGLENCYRRCAELQQQFALLTGATPEGHIHWFETHKRSVSLHLTPLSIAESFQQNMQASDAAWVFTSATLAVGQRFDYFTERLGLEDIRTAQWESPFDYANQALFYVPVELPMPGSADYTRMVIDKALPVLAASQGRAFLLFTSYRALQEAAGILADEVDFPLFIQGDAPRDILLERFRTTPHAVLLGTSSFWEGVDVRGEALSVVIIDKLPFASPGDPVLSARIEAMRNNGINAFMKHQVPEAVIALKQGAGRLIRDVSDRGVLMICDPRLIDKPYGKAFLDSLPAMTRTRSLGRVCAFLRQENPVTDSQTKPRAVS